MTEISSKISSYGGYYQSSPAPQGIAKKFPRISTGDRVSVSREAAQLERAYGQKKDSLEKDFASETKALEQEYLQNKRRLESEFQRKKQALGRMSIYV